MAKQKGDRSIFKAIVLLLLVGLLVVFFIIYRRGTDSKQSDSGQVAQADIASQLSPTPISVNDLAWKEGQTIKAAILMYHHIGPLPEDADAIRQGLTVSLENFEVQMKFLKQNGYHVMTMKEMYILVAQEKLPPKTVVLTFDDGYKDNYLYAEPVLEENGFKATFNIITGKIGQDEYMTEPELVSLSNKGNELASHTVTHPALNQLTGATLQKELIDSKIELEKITGDTVITLCYPAGKYSAEVETDAKGDGYKTAVTTEASKGSFSTSRPYEIPRYRIGPATKLDSILKITDN